MPEIETITDGTDPKAGHQWRHIYFDDELVDVICALCAHRPTELLHEDFTIAPCRGQIAALVKSFI